MPYDFSTFVRNCDVEQETPIPGNVSGTIPPWLKGSLIVNGPGRMKFGEQEYLHFFDGAAILQKVNFAETGPTYSSRFLRSNAYLVNSENNQIVVSEFATKGTAVKDKNSFQKLKEKFTFDKMFSDNAAVNVVKYGDGFYAITESPFVHQICPKNLETLNKLDLHKELGVSSQCAHPMYLKDGSSINIFHNIGATGPRYDVLKFPAKDNSGSFPKPTKIASVDARWKLNPCLMHSFGMTENYIIMPEQPLTIDVKSMVANSMKDKTFVDGVEWINDKLVKFHVVCMKTGKELKFRLKSEAFFYLHIVNSYEEDKFIVMDVCAFKKPDMLESFYLKKLRENGDVLWKELDKGTVKRLVLPLEVSDKSSAEENLITLKGSNAKAHRQKDGVVVLTPEEVTGVCYENPTMNPNFASQPYNFFYGASSELEESCGKVAKVSVRDGSVKVWSQKDLYAATLSFIPRPGNKPGQGEDDGVVLVTCLHGEAEKNKFDVVVLDASDMSEKAVVTFNLPSEAARPIHGIFIDE